MVERLRSVLVLVATAGMIWVNYLAATGQINGITTAAISDKYATVVTPAGYAFSIWSLIYIGLIAFSIYQLRPSASEKYSRIRTIYILSCVLNSAWIYFWQYDRIAVCLALIVLLAVSLFLINRFLRTSRTTAEYWLVNGPFGVYFGWVTAAALVNFAVLLLSLNLQFTETTWTIIGVLILLTAALLGVLMRIRLANYFYPLAVAWALTAIAIKQSGINTAVVVACALGVVACLIAALSFVLKLPSTSTRADLINE